MKNANLFGAIFLSVALVAGMSGCKSHTPPVTPIPDNGGPPSATTQTPTQPVVVPQAPPPVAPATIDNGIGTAPPTPINGQPIPTDTGNFTALFSNDHNENRDQFKADTVHFDFDSSTIKASEESKLQDVAGYFKDNKKYEGLIIEGNCDERGTEKYNLSLGERRALAVREYLANLGVNPQRIKTVTYGAARPVDPGHDESAWKQNRRAEFVLVTPKQ